MNKAKLYQGTKRLRAIPMSRGDYNVYRGWITPEGENTADEGYLVEYQDGGKANDHRHVGYISWSPKEVFENSYQELPTPEPIRYEPNHAPRVSMADVLGEIVGETYTVLPSGRVTVCELTLKNGFTVRGESAVVFIENNVPKTGREVARENAVNQIWQLLGFRRREQHVRPVLTEGDAQADLDGTRRPDHHTD